MQTKAKRSRARSAPVTLVQERPVRSVAPPPRAAATAPAPAAAPDEPPAGPPPEFPHDPTTALDAHGFDPAAYRWVPVLRGYRVDGWTPERQRAFIGYLADTGSVRIAAQETGLSASSAYRLRRAPEGKVFAIAWEAAMQQAAHTLVDAAFERAVHGSEEPVFNRAGHVVGRRFRQSDAMMMFLLRKHFPDRYGDLHRGRATPALAATAPLPGPLAETLERLGPVMPADPAATLDPALLSDSIAAADAGHVPTDLRPIDHDAFDPPEEFETTIAAMKAAADAETSPPYRWHVDDHEWP